MRRNLLNLCIFTVACASLCVGGTVGVGDDVSAVPEPGSLILLGTTVAGIGYAAWRRRRNR